MLQSLERKKIQITEPSVGEEEWLATRDCFESGWLTQGPKVKAFEEAFAEFHGVKHALAVSSCTTGLHLALLALGIGAGDEVIVPAFTWIATANVVLYCGATPIFVDVDRFTYNLDPTLLAEKITSKTKAIIPVHLFGQCADIDRIKQMIPDHVKIVEDAACAVGATYKGSYAGSLGDIGVFSFHPRKIITTGEGGMITTDNDALAEMINQLRSHGATVSEEVRHRGPKPHLLPDFNLLGFNYRMTDLQGAVGCVQMQKLERLIEERERLAEQYINRLRDVSWLTLPGRGEGGHSWQSFVCRVDESTAPFSRNELMEYLQENGVSTRPGTHAVHKLGYYRKRFGDKIGELPVAEELERSSLALPFYNGMNRDCAEFIVNLFYEVCQGCL